MADDMEKSLDGNTDIVVGEVTWNKEKTIQT